MMKPLNERIHKLAPFGVTSRRMLNEWADEAAKLLQAVNDKDQELFESQELVANLADALKAVVEWDKKEMTFFAYPFIEKVNEAIRKAKER